MAPKDRFFQTQATWAANFGLVQRPAQPLSPADKDRKKQEFRTVIQTTTQDMVDYFKKQNDKNYRMLRVINVLIIVAGFLLLAASIVRGFVDGVDAFTVLGSAIAVADFVTIFLVNPQSRITGSLVDSAQFDTIMITWGVACSARV